LTEEELRKFAEWRLCGASTTSRLRIAPSFTRSGISIANDARTPYLSMLILAGRPASSIPGAAVARSSSAQVMRLERGERASPPCYMGRSSAFMKREFASAAREGVCAPHLPASNCPIYSLIGLPESEAESLNSEDWHDRKR
jgi:hypothetical protein